MNTAEKYAYEAKQQLDQADLEGRDLTPEERGRFETALAKSRQAREAEGDGKAQAERIGRMIGGDDISASGQPAGWAGVANAIANKKQYSVEVPTEGLVGKAAPARGKALTANDLDEGAPFQSPASCRWGPTGGSCTRCSTARWSPPSYRHRTSGRKGAGRSMAAAR